MQKGTRSDYHHPANYVLMSLLGGVYYYSHPSFLIDTFFKPYKNYVSFTTIAVATAFYNSLKLYISTYPPLFVRIEGIFIVEHFKATRYVIQTEKLPRLLV